MGALRRGASGGLRSLDTVYLSQNLLTGRVPREWGPGSFAPLRTLMLVSQGGGARGEARSPLRMTRVLSLCPVTGVAGAALASSMQTCVPASVLAVAESLQRRSMLPSMHGG